MDFQKGNLTRDLELGINTTCLQTTETRHVNNHDLLNFYHILHSLCTLSHLILRTPLGVRFHFYCLREVK